MSLKRRMRELWFRFVVVPMSVVGAAFWLAYGRIALFLSMRGMSLPGTNTIRKQMSSETLAAYERKALIKNIKGQRYTLRHGPLWARSFADKLLRLVSRNRFWFLVVTKSFVGFVLVALPLGIFLLLRGWLPVPERVPVLEAKVQLKSRTQLRTDWLYTEAPFLAEASRPATQFQFLTSEFARGVRVTPVLEPSAPPGIFHFGIGSYPGRVDLLRGFLMSEKAPLVIPRQRVVHIDIEGRNRLRARFYLFPQPQGRGFCRLEVRDRSGKLLMSSEAQTPPKTTPENRTSLSVQFKNRFTPAATSDSVNSGIKEFILDTDNPPDELHVSVAPLRQPANAAVLPGTRSVLAAVADLPSFVKPARSAALGKDLKDENCIYALGDFGFEWEQVRPLARRGVVLIVVDSLRASAAYDPKLMPRLNNFAKNSALALRQHRAQSNESFASMGSLLTSRYPREFRSVAFQNPPGDAARELFLREKWLTLPMFMREKGYRTAALGGVSKITETMPGGVDFGFHDAVVFEAPQYETRHVTEEAMAWLERYGDAPFFLLLNYRTMRGPYRPPLENLDVKKALAHPFGLRHETELYNGLARYFDSEFETLLGKLTQLGIVDDVDLLVTSSQGAQLELQPFGYFPGVPTSLQAATRSDGHTLLDEELRVPLLMRIAGMPHLAGVEVRQPSAHTDLFPTLAALVAERTEQSAAEQPSSVQASSAPVRRGLNLYRPLQDLTKARLETLLAGRKSIRAEGARHTGLLLFGDEFAANPMKYVRQFEPDESNLDLISWPYRTHQKWFAPEQFSAVDLHLENETPLAQVSAFALRKMREQDLQVSLSERQLKLVFKFSGPANFSLQFAEEGLKPVVIERQPNTLSVSRRKTQGAVFQEFSGVVSFDDILLVNFGDAELVGLKVAEGSRQILVGCPAAFTFEPSAFVLAAQNRQLCLFSRPLDLFVKNNYSENERPIAVHFVLKNLPPEITGSAPGDTQLPALLNTLFQGEGNAP